MNIKQCYLNSKEPNDFIRAWAATAEDTPCYGLDGTLIEVTSWWDDSRQYSTGAGNRRLKEAQAKRYLCLHYFKHKTRVSIKYYDYEEYSKYRYCNICDIQIW